MGSPSGKDGRDDDECQYQVRLTDGFGLGKYEVTQGQWKALMESNPSSCTNAGSNAPVERVSWNDVMDFCRRSGRVGRRQESTFYVHSDGGAFAGSLLNRRTQWSNQMTKSLRCYSTASFSLNTSAILCWFLLDLFLCFSPAIDGYI
ncbi:MAG: formylglycine-generating enzyme family protein [Opitutales bacterium]